MISYNTINIFILDISKISIEFSMLSNFLDIGMTWAKYREPDPQVSLMPGMTLNYSQGSLATWLSLPHSPLFPFLRYKREVATVCIILKKFFFFLSRKTYVKYISFIFWQTCIWDYNGKILLKIFYPRQILSLFYVSLFIVEVITPSTLHVSTIICKRLILKFNISTTDFY